jgi:hypothetical protein
MAGNPMVGYGGGVVVMMMMMMMMISTTTNPALAVLYRPPAVRREGT